MDSRNDEVVFPDPPFGDTNAMVGMGTSEGQRKGSRMVSESYPIARGYVTDI
jgi:hypothetical protein